jgi:hypothetical protein
MALDDDVWDAVLREEHGGRQSDEAAAHDQDRGVTFRHGGSFPTVSPTAS